MRRPHGAAWSLPRALGRAVALVAVVPVGCSSATTLSRNSLPPLQSGAADSTIVPVTTAAGPTTPAGATQPTGLPGTVVAPTTKPAHVTWGGWPYYEVPPLVVASERGTGCASVGAIGDVVPDGVWNVLIGDGSGADRFFTAASISIDIRCVYTGAEGQQRWTAACAAAPTADPCNGQAPAWFVVNNSKRLRTMPVSATLQYGVGALGTSPCPGAPKARSATDAPWRSMDNWVVIDQGIVTVVVAACPAG